MNGLPYYKAYPRDFIEGTIGMPLELKGAYRVVLDLIYMQGGELPDDPRYIAGMLGCTIRKWKSIRKRLLELGKLQVTGEFLTNFRAVSELETLSKLQEKMRENRSRPNKNNNLESQRFNQAESEPEPESDIIRKQSDQHQPTVSDKRQKDAALERRDLNKIEHKLRKAAGCENSFKPGLMILAPILGLMDNGADLDQDILPAIRARPNPKAASWSYFVGQIQDYRAKRQSARDAPLPDHADPPSRKKRYTMTDAAKKLLEQHRQFDERSNQSTGAIIDLHAVRSSG